MTFRSTTETIFCPFKPEGFDIALPQLVGAFANHDTVYRLLHFLLSLAATVCAALSTGEIDSPRSYSTQEAANLKIDAQVLDAGKVRGWGVVTEKFALVINSNVAAVQKRPRHREAESAVFIE